MLRAGEGRERALVAIGRKVPAHGEDVARDRPERREDANFDALELRPGALLSLAAGLDPARIRAGDVAVAARERKERLAMRAVELLRLERRRGIEARARELDPGNHVPGRAPRIDPPRARADEVGGNVEVRFLEGDDRCRVGGRVSAQDAPERRDALGEPRVGDGREPRDVALARTDALGERAIRRPGLALDVEVVLLADPRRELTKGGAGLVVGRGLDETEHEMHAFGRAHFFHPGAYRSTCTSPGQKRR